jgi:hypothetical protein
MAIEFNEVRNSIIRLLVEPTDELNGLDNLQTLKEWLMENISWLIDNDFERLLVILYRIDVSEMRLKRLIEQNEGENAAEVIADLMIERETQKAESRKKYSALRKDISIDESETWD